MCFGWLSVSFGPRFRDSGFLARERAPERWGREKRGKLRRRLFHREERPTLERNIIDTSERTCANHRYVMGVAFWVLAYTSEARRTCKYFVLELPCAKGGSNFQQTTASWKDFPSIVQWMEKCKVTFVPAASIVNSLW